MAWVPALKVGLVLAAVLVVLPRILFPAPKTARGVVDRLMIDMIRITAFLIALVHILVPLQLFQWAGVLLVGAVWIYAVRLRPAGWDWQRFVRWASRTSRTGLYLIEAGSREGNEGVKAAVSQWWRDQVRPRLRPRLPDERRSRVVGAVLLVSPLVALLAGSLAIRLLHPLQHVAFPSSDGYVHLAWIKYLEAGSIFHDGVYPHGMHATLAFMSKLFPVSSLHTLRFSGAFFNTLTVLVVYLVALRSTRHAGASLLPAAAVGLLGVRPEVGLTEFRQAGTLPQEFALLFAFAAMLMALEYLARPSRERLLLLGMAAFVVAMSHPLGSGIVFLVAGCVGVAAAMRARRVGPAVRVALATGAGTLLGHVYLLALLFGGGLYGRINVNVVSSPSGSTSEGVLSSVPVPQIAESPLRVLAVAGAAFGLVAGIAMLKRTDRSRLLAPTLAFVLLAAAALQFEGDLILRKWYLLRWTELVWPLLPLGLALGAAPVLAVLRLGRGVLVRSGFAVAGGLAVTLGLVFSLPPVVASSRFQVEYESAARVIGVHISNDPRFSFTVVGPPSWYDRVLGAGYHIHLTDFADTLDVEHAIDPAFTFPVATERIYVLTEKDPFRFEFAGRVGGGVGRYFDPEERGRMMRAVDTWLQTYARTHDGVRVVHENEEIRLWLIEHEGDLRYADRWGLAGRIGEDAA